MFGLRRRRRPEEDQDPDAYVRAFYEQLQPESGWVEKAGRLRQFVEAAQAEALPASTSVDYGSSLLIESNGSCPTASSRRFEVVVVTSGSVAVPLDTDGVNRLETVSSGNRGAACAEAFLKAGYWVLFLYADDSLRPFSRIVSKRLKKQGTPWLEQLRVNPETGRVEMALEAEEEAAVKEAIAQHAALKPRLLELPFTGIYEYLFLLRESCLAVKPFGTHASLFLAAGAWLLLLLPGSACFG